jgi:N-dimethylarginine dimethylaminohydrolase
MKTTWSGKLEDFPLENFPDYEPGRPPNLMTLHEATFLDEYEKIWGRPWGGCQGIGKLRDAGLVRATEREGNPLWTKDPDYFLLRYSRQIDVPLLIDNQLEYAQKLEENGVTVHWMDVDDAMGAYGPMRKLFIAEEAMIIRGGAILPRPGHGAYKRGLEREYQKFLTDIGCPILLTVHGRGIAEPSAMIVAVAENTWVAGISSSMNRDALDQIIPVLHRQGGKEVHVTELPVVLDTLEAAGEFHLDMILAPVDLRKILVYPKNLGWETYEWLCQKGFELIEIPEDEQRWAPANLTLLEPGKILMHPQAINTTRALEKAGVEVIPFDWSGLMQGGVNGPRCCTLFLYREPGPGLDE